jgi:hypothetical protein
VYYLDINGQINEMAWTGDQMGNHPLGYEAAPGSSLTCFGVGGKYTRLYYLDGEGRINELAWSNGGWANHVRPGTASPESALTCFGVNGTATRLYYADPDKPRQRNGLADKPVREQHPVASGCRSSARRPPPLSGVPGRPRRLPGTRGTVVTAPLGDVGSNASLDAVATSTGAADLHRERAERYKKDRESWRARLAQYQAVRCRPVNGRDRWWSLEDPDAHDFMACRWPVLTDDFKRGTPSAGAQESA